MTGKRWAAVSALITLTSSLLLPMSTASASAAPEPTTTPRASSTHAFVAAPNIHIATRRPASFSPQSTKLEKGISFVGGTLGEPTLNYFANYIYGSVVNAVRQSQNRAGVIDGLMWAAYFHGQHEDSVAVYDHDGNFANQTIRGITFHALYHFSGYPTFEVVKFTGGGYLHNSGDGGYNNWHFVAPHGGHWQNPQHHMFWFNPR